MEEKETHYGSDKLSMEEIESLYHADVETIKTSQILTIVAGTVGALVSLYLVFNFFPLIGGIAFCVVVLKSAQNFTMLTQELKRITDLYEFGTRSAPLYIRSKFEKDPNVLSRKDYAFQMLKESGNDTDVPVYTAIFGDTRFMVWRVDDKTGLSYSRMAADISDHMQMGTTFKDWCALFDQFQGAEYVKRVKEFDSAFASKYAFRQNAEKA